MDAAVLEPQEKEIRVLDWPMAVISDIHAHLEAFEAVLEDIDRRDIKTILSCGDLVGYGPNPKECIALAKKHITDSVIGNHDFEVYSMDDILNAPLNRYAGASLTWTHDILSDEEREYLRSQPYILFSDDFIVSHGSAVPHERGPYLPGIFTYIDDKLEEREVRERRVEKNMEYLEQHGKSVLFYGHSHVQSIKLPKGKSIPTLMGKIEESGVEESDIALPYKYCLVNAGSVGQPRDYNIKACYLQWDGSHLKVIHVPYDFRKTQEKILVSGLPEEEAQFLAQRLEMGR